MKRLNPKSKIKTRDRNEGMEDKLLRVDQLRDFDRPRSYSVDHTAERTGPQNTGGTPAKNSNADDKGSTVSTVRRGSLSPEPVKDTTVHIVAVDDSLTSIAVQYNTTTSELRKINRLMSSMLHPGQVLYVPTADYKPAAYGSGAVGKSGGENLLGPPSDYPQERRFTDSAVQGLKVDDNKQKNKKNKKNKKPDKKTEVLPEVERREKPAEYFIAEVPYLTGERNEDALMGTLTITPTEVKFDPRDPETDEQRVVWEIVKYRMSLGQVLRSVKICDVNPVSLHRVDSHKLLHNTNTSLQHITEDNDPTSEVVGSLDNSGIFFLAPDQKASPVGGAAGGAHTKLNDSQSPDKSGVVITITEPGESKPSCYTESGTNESGQSTRRHDIMNVRQSSGERKLNGLASVKHVHIQDDEGKEAHEQRYDTSHLKYLRIKLGHKDSPTVSSLIASMFRLLPVASGSMMDDGWTRHCFAIPFERVDELSAYLNRWYTDLVLAHKQSPPEQEEQVRRVASELKILRRNLSILEVCRLPLPEMSRHSDLLTDNQIRILCEHLLTIADGRPWLMVYGTEQHGFSLSSLYRNTSKLESATLLLVRDSEMKVFGAMLPCSIRCKEGYYGTGESFLFKFEPIFKKYCWSEKNDFFINGTTTSLSIGSGDGTFGLWMDDDLHRGKTQRCDTFDNDPLTDSIDFLINAIEIWSFPFSLPR